MDHLQKTKKNYKKFKKTGNSRYIYQNKLDKVCFQHDMAYGDFKDLLRIDSDKILHDIAFNIAKNRKCDGHQRDFDKKSTSLADKSATGSGIKNVNISNQELAEELHKPITDNIWGADLVNMQLISKFNKGIHFLSCVIDVFRKYAWVIPLKDKKGITITNAFQKILN